MGTEPVSPRQEESDAAPLATLPRHLPGPGVDFQGLQGSSLDAPAGHVRGSRRARALRRTHSLGSEAFNQVCTVWHWLPLRVDFTAGKAAVWTRRQGTSGAADELELCDARTALAARPSIRCASFVMWMPLPVDFQGM